MLYSYVKQKQTVSGVNLEAAGRIQVIRRTLLKIKDFLVFIAPQSFQPLDSTYEWMKNSPLTAW